MTFLNPYQGHSSIYPVPPGAAAVMPTQYPNTISINGRNFTVNTSFEPYRREAFRHRTIQPQRQSINFSNVSGYGTLNTEGLWRRDQLDWSEGAGQQFLDRQQESSSSRFLSSTGIDVWTENQITLLPDTKQYSIPSISNKTITVGTYWVSYKNSYVYFYNSDYSFYNGKLPSSLISSTLITDSPTIYDICTDGNIVYVATSNGIWTINTAGKTSNFEAKKFVSIGQITNYTISIDNVTGLSGHNDMTYTSSLPAAVQTGMLVTGSHIPDKTYITSVTGNTLSLSQKLTDDSRNIAITCYINFGYNIDSYRMVRICNDVLIASAHGGVLSPITAISSSGGTWTFTAANTLSTGDTITIAGCTPNSYNGQRTVASATSTSFTVNGGTNPGAGTAFGGFYVGTGSTNCMLNFNTIPNANVPPNASQVLMIHPDSQWEWTCATGGMTQIYIGGHRTDNNAGAIYRATMNGLTANTSVNQPFSLNYPTLTLPLENGEYPTALYGYLNYIFLGTNLGIRMCQTLNAYDPTATSGGDLKAGPLSPNLLQPVNAPVRAIVGRGRFVYFGWSNYEQYKSGIGRMDITKFINNDPLSPVYASDLMVTQTQGEVTWMDIHPNSEYPYFNIEDYGTWGAKRDMSGQIEYVYYGKLNTGYITYGISDNKIPVKIDYSAQNNSGYVNSNITYYDANDNDYTIQTGAYNGSEIDIRSGFARSEKIGLQIDLVRDNNDASITPIVYRCTLKSWPCAVSETMISPVVSFFKNNLSGAQVTPSDPYQDFMFLQHLLVSQTVVEYREGPLSAYVVVEGLDWLPHKVSDNYERGFVGECVVTLKTIGGYRYLAANTE